ncbi:MAG: hypothetical protein A2905_02405 [Candidatus Levybacteria bacterium RIFCSPLOWO2_01_FULL_36_10]|nr:MAG: hypothetical protein A2905_02405 [Candidatus Levybacteria bacterium RIFCSPLOWO2_01_FULL_36_10]
MKIKDVIYGKFEIKEPVLLELLKSKPLQRLKKIDQYGIPPKFYLFPGFTRLEHLVGVMLLLKKMGADVEEQVAGLLHDVSHTAFSHVVDWVIGDALRENYQDKNHKKIIYQSEIPGILSRFGFDVKKITTIVAFPLLERESPDLCADRIDYALREFYLWANSKIVDLCVKSLVIFQNKFVFDSKIAAGVFAKNFIKLQSEHWGGGDAVTRYYYLSQGLKIALDKKIITLEDFYFDDEYVINKILKSKNNILDRILKILSKKTKFKNKKKGIILKKKFRFVDPEFLDNGKLKKLSEEDSVFSKLLEKHRKINEKGIMVKSLTKISEI